MKNPSCFWHHLIFNPHPPFSRPAAGSGFFDSKTSKLLRCWTRYYAGARSQYLARARGAHRAGRAGRGGQGGGGRLLLAAVQGIRAGDREQRRGAAGGAGRKRKQAGRAVCPALPVVLSAAVLSSQRRRGRPAWATLAAICSTVPRFTECRRGTFHGAAGRYFHRAGRGIYSPPNGIEKQV